MKIIIEDRYFDTDKATEQWDLLWVDEDGTRHTGNAYRSSKGTFYVGVSRKNTKERAWKIMTASEILATYKNYLDDNATDTLGRAGGIEWE